MGANTVSKNLLKVAKKAQESGADGAGVFDAINTEAKKYGLGNLKTETEDSSSVEEADGRRVLARFKEIFNGQEKGADFKAKFEAISENMLGTDHKAEWDEWMNRYLIDQTPTAGLFTGGSADTYNSGKYFGADAPSEDFKEYTKIRYELVNTVNTGGETMDFEKFKKWLELRAKTTEVGDFFTARIESAIPKITESLIKYLPTASDVYEFTTRSHVEETLIDILRTHSKASTLFPTDQEILMNRRIEQIIGALYLKNNASAGEIWDAFHHGDMGTPPEITTWLTGNLFGADHTDGKPTQPDVPATTTAYDGTHIFGDADGDVSGAVYLTALAGDREDFAKFLEGPNDVSDPNSGAGSRLAPIGHTGAKHSTNDNKRKGFVVFARTTLAERIMSHNSDPGTRILKRFIGEFQLDTANNLEDRKAAVEDFFKSVDVSREACNDADTWFGGGFNADPATTEETKKMFFCLPVKSDKYDSDAKFRETLDKLYNGNVVDPSNFPDIAKGMITTQEAAMIKALKDFAIGDDSSTRTDYTPIEEADLTEAKFSP